MKYFIFIALFVPIFLLGQGKGIDSEGHIPKGLMVGHLAPEISLTSIDGKTVNSTDILKDKQVVVIFYRGKWCPVCSRYLSNLNDSLGFILEHNAEVLVIGPETFESSSEIAEETKAKFTLLPDTSHKVLEAFDVMFDVTKGYVRKIKTFKGTDIAENNNKETARLPVPATYIIGKDGKIKWRHFDHNYSIRASAREIIDNLKK